MRRAVPTVAWVLLGLLALAGVLITLGKRENQANPSIDSYGPSGLHLLASLLQRDGYQVIRESSAIPKLLPGDIPIAIYPQPDLPDLEDESPIEKELGRFVDHGGRAVRMSLDPDFGGGSLEVGTPVVATRAVSNRKLQVQTRRVASIESLGGVDDTWATLWSALGDRSLASLVRYGPGTVLVIGDGYMATNRFIDHAQNADVLLDAIHVVAPKGSRLVFTEATFSGGEPGLIEILGPWATAGWYQILFLFVVVVFTLGKRFGLPEEMRPRQTGQRELVDAIADVYRRGRSTKVACRSAYDRADAEVRKSLRLGSDAPIAERDVRVPPALATMFRHTFEGTIDTLSPQEALKRCSALQSQVRAFRKR